MAVRVLPRTQRLMDGLVRRVRVAAMTRIDNLTSADVALILTALALLAGRIDDAGRARCMRLVTDIADGYAATKETT